MLLPGTHPWQHGNMKADLWEILKPAERKASQFPKPAQGKRRESLPPCHPSFSLPFSVISSEADHPELQREVVPR